MLTIEFTIPDEVEAYIKDVLKIEPKTYIQNKLIDPIFTQFKSHHMEKAITEAKTTADAEIATAKKGMKIKLTDKVQ